jgi:hypothetical protein
LKLLVMSCLLSGAWGTSSGIITNGIAEAVVPGLVP